jgi:fusicocca-2,10(14)-diene synthase/ophiobolin F synthase
MDLAISDEEMAMMQNITEPAYSTLALANDYFSWQKEYDEFLNNSELDDMANAIWILTKEKSVGVEDAKKICHTLIRELYQDFR